MNRKILRSFTEQADEPIRIPLREEMIVSCPSYTGTDLVTDGTYHDPNNYPALFSKVAISGDNLRIEKRSGIDYGTGVLSADAWMYP